MKHRKNRSDSQKSPKKKKNGSISSKEKKKRVRKQPTVLRTSISTPQLSFSQPQSQSQRRTYRRGPVCGVQNCPSTLYFSLNGHRTCQYGHVMTNDFEFDDDAVPASASGGSGATTGTIRRLKLGLDSRGNFTSNEAAKRGYAKVMAKRKREREILYGEEGKELYCNICQSILEWQVYKMGDLLHLNELEKKIYENIVFKLWSKYLESMMDADNGDRLNLLKLDLLSLLSIHYLALTMVMKMDIFTDDFIKMIETFELPHLNCLKLFPYDHQLKKLPNYFIKRISGKQIFPDNNVLVFYRKLTFMTYAVRFRETLEKSADLRFDIEFPWKQFIKRNLAFLHLDEDAKLEKLIIDFVESSFYLNKKVRFIPEMKSIDHTTLTCFHELLLLASICLVLKSVIYLEHGVDEKKQQETPSNSDEEAENASLKENVQNFDDGSKILSESRVSEWLSWFNGIQPKLFASQLISKDYWSVANQYNDRNSKGNKKENTGNTKEHTSYIDKYLDFVQENIVGNYSVETSTNKTNKIKKKNAKILPVLDMIPLRGSNAESDDSLQHSSIYDLSSSINLGAKDEYSAHTKKKQSLVLKNDSLALLYESVKQLINSNFRFQANIPVPGGGVITPLEKTIEILQSRKDIQ